MSLFVSTISVFFLRPFTAFCFLNFFAQFLMQFPRLTALFCHFSVSPVPCAVAFAVSGSGSASLFALHLFTRNRNRQRRNMYTICSSLPSPSVTSQIQITFVAIPVIGSASHSLKSDRSSSVGHQVALAVLEDTGLVTGSRSGLCLESSRCILFA